jgi:succinate-semialdehyde dehydrogenase/glutarate-semialdehyde dehydrogenase
MLQSINPATEKEVHKQPPLSDADCHERIQRSHEAYLLWKERSFSERADVLKKVAQVMKDDIERLALLMTDEMGKPIKEARGEVQKAVWCAEHYAEHAEQYLAPVTMASDATHSYVQHLPIGPILGILPWNAPFWLAFRFCAPALMAGNTCLMKHDPHVPLCAQAIADVFAHAGAPINIMQNLPIETPQVEAVIRHKFVRGVSLTGSSAAGSKVAAIAGSEIKPVVLELGGSDPVIVMADADLDKAADVITLSRIINAGQSCIATKRIIVESPVYDEFIAKLEARLSKLKVGDPRSEQTDIGPIARPDLRDTLARQVNETVKAGARCVIGGEVPDAIGYFYPATLLADVTNDMVACREETFGPVAVVLKAQDLTDAVRIANDTEYGLAASIWTDTKRAESVINQFESGQVTVNGIVKTDPRLPSGGIKRSGLGRELGPHGILAFVNAQQVWIGPKVE